MVTKHAKERLKKRLIQGGLSPEDSAQVLETATAFAIAAKYKSEAILVYRMDRQIGKAWGNRSNGDTVWAIVRDNKVITFMFRRSTQPTNPENLRVDYVRFAT